MTTLTLSDSLEPLQIALRRGDLVVIPTDTVYGLACLASDTFAFESMCRVKKRSAMQPCALIYASLESAAEIIGENSEARRALQTGATVIVANPERRYRHLCGSTPEKIGLRVPALDNALAAALADVGPIAATSANRHGDPDPTTFETVPASIAENAAVCIDGGETQAGKPSTVIDLTADEPAILREGAQPTKELLDAQL